MGATKIISIALDVSGTVYGLGADGLIYKYEPFKQSWALFVGVQPS